MISSKASTGMSPNAMTVSLFKSIIGIGVFALSVHIARGPGLVPACLIATAIGCLSAYTFYLVARAAAR